MADPSLAATTTPEVTSGAVGETFSLPAVYKSLFESFMMLDPPLSKIRDFAVNMFRSLVKSNQSTKTILECYAELSTALDDFLTKETHARYSSVGTFLGWRLRARTNLGETIATFYDDCATKLSDDDRLRLWKLCVTNYWPTDLESRGEWIANHLDRVGWDAKREGTQILKLQLDMIDVLADVEYRLDYSASTEPRDKEIVSNLTTSRKRCHDAIVDVAGMAAERACKRRRVEDGEKKV
jgi:hypothetical protein